MANAFNSSTTSATSAPKVRNTSVNSRPCNPGPQSGYFKSFEQLLTLIKLQNSGFSVWKHSKQAAAAATTTSCICQVYIRCILA